MPIQSIRSARYRAALFAPTDEAALLRHYTLSEADSGTASGCFLNPGLNPSLNWRSSDILPPENPLHNLGSPRWGRLK